MAKTPEIKDLGGVGKPTMPTHNPVIKDLGTSDSSSSSLSSTSNSSTSTTLNPQISHEPTIAPGCYCNSSMVEQRLNTTKRRVFTLAGLALVLCLGFIGWGFPSWGGFVFNFRVNIVWVICLVGAATACATIIFQAIINNRIVTPSVLGLDRLFLLIQTTIVFFQGAVKLTAVNQTTLFILSLVFMMLFTFILFKIMFRRENNNVFFISLLGIVFGTFFSSMTTFMANLLDPSEFQIVLNIGFASFDAINENAIYIATLCFAVTFGLIAYYSKYLSVIALGRDTAVNLGVNYNKISQRLMFIVAFCISVSTALVGPITFLGIIVLNVTLQMLPTMNYRWLLAGASFLTICILMSAHILVYKILQVDSTLSIIINFVGGIYFLLLLLKEQKKW